MATCTAGFKHYLLHLLSVSLGVPGTMVKSKGHERLLVEGGDLVLDLHVPVGDNTMFGR